MAIEVKISQLPNAAAITGTEKFPAVQAAATVAPTLAQVRTYTDVTASGFAAGAQASAIATASGYAVDSLNTAITVASGYAVDARNTAIATASGYTESYTNGKIATLSGYVDARLDPIEDFKAYDATRTYALNDPTFYAGVPYKSLSAGNAGHQPDTSPTYWEVTGGGSGIASVPGVNYDNGQFENKLALGYITYADAAQDTPVDGTGGTPNVTFAHSTTTPLIGVGSGVLTKDAVNRQGQGVSYDFTIDRGKTILPQLISFIYETNTNYVSSDMGVYIYDKTNAILIPLSVNEISSSYGKPAQFKAAFIPSTSTEYRLIFHVRTTNALAYTLKLDDIEIGDKQVASGAAISEWKSYIPVIAGLGSVTTVQFQYRRNGSSIDVQGRCITGTPTTANITIGLPAGLTAKYNVAYNYLCGRFVVHLATANTFKGGIVRFTSGDAFVVLGRDDYTTPADPSSILQGSAIPSSTGLAFDFSVPIAQWTSNVNLAEDFTVYKSHNGTVENTGIEGALIPTTTPTGTFEEHTLTFNNINPSDRFEIEIQLGGTGAWTPPSVSVDYLKFDGTNYVGVSVYWTGTLVKIIRGKYRTGTTTPWSTLAAGTRWRVRKISNGNMAEVPPLVRAEYKNLGGNAESAIVPYTTKVEDTHNAVTTGTGWKFTAPISGVYLISAGVYGSTTQKSFWLKLNTITRQVMGTLFPGASDYASALSSAQVRLQAGDYISVYGSSQPALVSDQYCIQITRLGN